jgi:hypothetical protein
VDRWVTVQRVTVEQMRDVVADHDGAEGAWDADTVTISVRQDLSRRRQWRVLAHECQHALVDLLDP